MVPRFIAAALAGEPLTIYGDGLQSRDFTYVGNVVDANLLAASAEGVSGRIFNIATGSPTSVNDLADLIGTVVERPVRKELLAERAGDVRDSWADIEAARQALGWEPQVDAETGLRLTAASLTDAPPELTPTPSGR